MVKNLGLCREPESTLAAGKYYARVKQRAVAWHRHLREGALAAAHGRLRPASL